MKPVYKISLIILLFLTSCTKEVIQEVDDCQCTRTSYLKQEKTVVSNGLPRLVVTNTVRKKEKNIGCFLEGTFNTSQNHFYVIECVN